MTSEYNDSNITKTSFRFSTNILRRLGEELNPSPSQGLIELAKNAYDADALRCIVTLNNTDSNGGLISIEDDGDGMDVEEIINGWLVLGKSEKTIRGITRLGRRPSGDKGLGRLSALRMGGRVVLRSVPLSNPGIEHTLETDWERYKENSLVEDIELKIITTMNLEGRKPGTRISLENLKDSISRNEIQKLARGLILLADPFRDNPIGFSPILRASEYEDLERMVEAKYFNDAEYHLEAKLDDSGFAEAFVKDWRGETLFSGNHNELRQKDKDKPYHSCPN